MPLPVNGPRLDPWIVMFVNDGLNVFVNEIPSPVVFWMTPPELSPPTDALPLPVTVRLPFVPVLLRTIPLAAPFAEMLRKVRPVAPIVVLATLSAVAVVVVSVLTIVVLFCVALTVPPPVALKAMFAAVVRLSPPVRLMVAPVLVLERMPLAVLEIAPLKATVPPVLFWICTGRPPAAEIVPG